MFNEEKMKLNNAKELLDSGRVHQALPILEDLYKQVDNDDVTVNYVRALYQAQQYMAASRVANDNQDYFLSGKEKLFVQIMLAAHKPLAARLFVGRVSSKQQLSLLKQIENAEEYLRSNFSATVRKNTANFYHMGDLSIADQFVQFEAADNLPLEDYSNGAKLILRDPNVYPLIKSSIARDLVALKVNDRFMIYWLDHQEHPFYPQKMDFVEDRKVIKDIKSMIEDEFANSNPLLYEQYRQTLRLQLMFLYPFVDVAIQDAETWFAVLVGKKLGQSKEIDKVAHWQRLIEELEAKMLAGMMRQ